MEIIRRISLIIILIVLRGLICCCSSSSSSSRGRYGRNKTELVAPICGKNHLSQNVTEYFKQYWLVTDNMHKEMFHNKFSYKSGGKPPDQLYVLAQCIGDLNTEECALCFSQITTLAASCFPYTSARVLLDGCFIRVENYSFGAEALSPQDTKRCSSDTNQNGNFGGAVKVGFMKILIDAGSGRGSAVMKYVSDFKGESAFSMATCWKTLDENLCQTCLSEAVTSALSCLPSAEALALNAGCFLRYSHVPFIHHLPDLEEATRLVVALLYVIGVFVICLVAIIVGISVGMYTYRRKNLLNKNKVGEMNLILDERLLLQFKYATLRTATDNFNETRRLGRGGFGEVYKGTLPDGREIAIKRLFDSKKSRIQDVCNEMDIIGKAQHKNLVRFLGCCFTKVDSFLVYEYMPNRSLDQILFDPAKKEELNWKTRLQIIRGTAEGLEYLHKDCEMPIIHRDIKASNVLLDLKYKPKISDFGLATFYSCDQSLANTAIAGTLGYMAPEYIANGCLTEKVDVYSFGVVVMEIVTGVRNNKFQSQETHDTLVTHVWKHFQANKVPEIVDRSTESCTNEENIEEIKRVVHIGLLCTQELPILRPTMTEVVQMLKSKEVVLPMPSRPPFTDEDMELHCLGSNS